MKPDLPAGIDKKKAREVYRKIAPCYDPWAQLTRVWVQVRAGAGRVKTRWGPGPVPWAWAQALGPVPSLGVWPYYPTTCP